MLFTVAILNSHFFVFPQNMTLLSTQLKIQVHKKVKFSGRDISSLAVKYIFILIRFLEGITAQQNNTPHEYKSSHEDNTPREDSTSMQDNTSMPDNVLERQHAYPKQQPCKKQHVCRWQISLDVV